MLTASEAYMIQYESEHNLDKILEEISKEIESYARLGFNYTPNEIPLPGSVSWEVCDKLEENGYKVELVRHAPFDSDKDWIYIEWNN